MSHVKWATAAAAVIAVLLVQGMAARTTNDTDRKALLDHLDRTRTAFLASIDGVGEEQWSWKAAPDRWSIAEVSEHITAAESFLRDVVTTQVMKEPATAELLEQTRGRDASIIQGIPDRSRKFQAPEPLRPTGRWKSQGEIVETFKTERATTMKLAGDEQKDLRAYAMSSPAGDLDAYQWLLFISAHTERHTKQIEEVKAAAGYPAR
jgi:hypothetical protein